MSAGKELLKEITNLALLAVGYDEQKDLEAAIYYYEEVVRSLESYLADAGNVVSNSFGDLKTKLTNYQERAQILRDKLEHGNFCKVLRIQLTFLFIIQGTMKRLPRRNRANRVETSNIWNFFSIKPSTKTNKII